MREKNSKNSKKFERVTRVPRTNETFDVDEKTTTNKPSAFYDSEPPCGPSNKIRLVRSNNSVGAERLPFLHTERFAVITKIVDSLELM